MQATSCNFCHQRNCDWEPIENFMDSLCFPAGKFATDEEVGVAQKIHNNCLTILKKPFFYVKNDRLEGFSKINIPMRIYNFILKTFFSEIYREQQELIVSKIEETFSYILKIRSPITNKNNFGNYLHPTYLFHESKYFVHYTVLAEKVMTQYSKEDFPELYYLANRILHERDGPSHLDNHRNEKPWYDGLSS